MSNLSCGTHVAEPSANKDCRKLLNQFCRFLPKLKLPISADAKLPLTHKPELDLDFSVRLQSEALEAVILLDVTEDRLWLYWTIASMIETSLACQQAFGFSPVGICLMIHLDCSAVRHSFIAYTSQRASGAVLRPVFADSGLISEFRS